MCTSIQFLSVGNDVNVCTRVHCCTRLIKYTHSNLARSFRPPSGQLRCPKKPRGACSMTVFAQAFVRVLKVDEEGIKFEGERKKVEKEIQW